jgi:hypothetical protein
MYMEFYVCMCVCACMYVCVYKHVCAYSQMITEGELACVWSSPTIPLVYKDITRPILARYVKFTANSWYGNGAGLEWFQVGACVHVCMCACMHVCMYACAHLYVCMYVRVYVCIFTENNVQDTPAHELCKC